MIRSNITWKLEDHLCMSCGGRILRSVSGAGMTPGGNPIFKCSDCGKTSCGLGNTLCWCNFTNKHNRDSFPYQCLSYSVLEDKPQYLRAFRNCGCDPERGGEVGIVLVSELSKIDSEPSSIDIDKQKQQDKLTEDFRFITKLYEYMKGDDKVMQDKIKDVLKKFKA